MVIFLTEDLHEDITPWYFLRRNKTGYRIYPYNYLVALFPNLLLLSPPVLFPFVFLASKIHILRIFCDTEARTSHWFECLVFHYVLGVHHRAWNIERHLNFHWINFIFISIVNSSTISWDDYICYQLSSQHIEQPNF